MNDNGSYCRTESRAAIVVKRAGLASMPAPAAQESFSFARLRLLVPELCWRALRIGYKERALSTMRFLGGLCHSSGASALLSLLRDLTMHGWRGASTLAARAREVLEGGHWGGGVVRVER